MAQLQPIPVPCPVCGEEILLRATVTGTSDKAPEGPHAAVFVRFSTEDFGRHLAAHIADLEEQAA